MTSDARDLEILVAKIQSQLAPGAQVIHGARIKGRITGRSRQIDVLVKQKIGQYEMVIVLECRDHHSPVDVNGVGAFGSFLEDVGAHKGALVCPRGFTKTAKSLAAAKQIDLYSPVDTDPHKWQVHLSVPVVCDFRRALIAFGLSGSAPKPFRLPMDFFSSSEVFDGDGNKLGTALNGAMAKWNEGQFPSEPGEHEGLPIFEPPTVQVDNGFGELIPVTLTASLLVSRQLFFGRIPISKMSGFKDELSGNVIANAFTLGIFDPDEIEETWQPIATMSDSPTRPIMTLVGLVGWSNN